MAVTAEDEGAVAEVGGSALIDSGSDDHLCRPKFVPDAPVAVAPKAPTLFDAQHEPLPTAGGPPRSRDDDGRGLEGNGGPPPGG